MPNPPLRSLMLQSGESIEIFIGRYSFPNILELASKYDVVEVRGSRSCGTPYQYLLTREKVKEKLGARNERKKKNDSNSSDEHESDEATYLDRKVEVQSDGKTPHQWDHGQFLRTSNKMY